MHKIIFQPRLNQFDFACITAFWSANVGGISLWITVPALLLAGGFSEHMQRRYMRGETQAPTVE